MFELYQNFIVDIPLASVLGGAGSVGEVDVGGDDDDVVDVVGNVGDDVDNGDGVVAADSDGADGDVDEGTLVLCRGDSNVVDRRSCRNVVRKEDAFFCGKNSYIRLF